MTDLVTVASRVIDVLDRLGVRYSVGLAPGSVEADTPPQIYLPAAQMTRPMASPFLLVRSGTGSRDGSVAATVRSPIRSVAPEHAVHDQAGAIGYNLMGRRLA